MIKQDGGNRAFPERFPQEGFQVEYSTRELNDPGRAIWSCLSDSNLLSPAAELQGTSSPQQSSSSLPSERFAALVIGYSVFVVPLPEKVFISEIRKLANSWAYKRRQRGIVTGIGDDCAVLRMPAGADILVTTDLTLEGVHFQRDWHSADSVGHRCLARGLSDIAAMGGKPTAAFLSLAVPRDLPQSWVNAFTRAVTHLAGRCGAGLVGGDTAQSPNGILADIIVVGTAPKGQAILRSGAHPGDRIFVTGELGGSAAAVFEMDKHGRLNPNHYQKHFCPEPRIEIGQYLRKKGIASAMIDTSDGLSTDLAHICEESQVGAEIDLARIPRARVGRNRHEVTAELALHGGEDYELLFTAAARRPVPTQVAGVKITEIGRVTAREGLFLRTGNRIEKLLPRGWEYFRKA